MAVPVVTKVFSCAGCRTCEWPTRFTVGSGVSPNRAAISAGRRSSNLSIWRAWKEQRAFLSTAGSSPQAGGPPALTDGFGWLPITGAVSRARSGVPWECGGPRLAPPAGAVRLTAKAGPAHPSG
jgi:hypothetical protein